MEKCCSELQIVIRYIAFKLFILKGSWLKFWYVFQHQLKDQKKNIWSGKNKGIFFSESVGKNIQFKDSDQLIKKMWN